MLCIYIYKRQGRKVGMMKGFKNFVCLVQRTNMIFRIQESVSVERVGWDDI